MSTATLLLSAMTVFFLMLVGIVLTVLEFKYGAPRQQEEAAKAKRKAHNLHSQDGYAAIESRQF